LWTTYVVASAQADERAQARLQLQLQKSDAKGELVDMLLSKGMLKIDAMSLADTLEGYPDLFVSVVTGESLAAAPAEGRGRAPPAEITATASEEERHLYGQAATGGSTLRQVLSQHVWRGFASYGRLTDYEMDPDAVQAQSVTRESRKESLFMMLGFSLFAVIPSWIFAWIPAIIEDTDGTTGHPSRSVGINPLSLVIWLTACIMWCLGVWKSRYLDSNWLLFGMEAVIVLLICIGCAYGLGALLNKLFLPEEYLLEVKTRKAASSSVVLSSASHLP
jgi:hypothetical protein